MIPGSSALILAFARLGTHAPPHYYNRLTPEGQVLADTDWHLERFFDGLPPEVTLVRASFNRCLSDLNAVPPQTAGRQAPPGGGVVPFETLTGAWMWERPPGPSEASSLRAARYVPYHAALSAQIARGRARHGFAVLIDCGARGDEARAGRECAPHRPLDRHAFLQDLQTDAGGQGHGALQQ